MQPLPDAIYDVTVWVEKARVHRANDAALDPAMRLELWDKTAQVSFDKKVLNELVSPRFLETHRHVCILARRRRCTARARRWRR